MNRPTNNQDKQAWCRLGEYLEKEFIDHQLPKLTGINGKINPGKQTNPYLYDIDLSVPADLKSVRTPYFKAKDLHGLDPQYAVTFNDKDGLRYSEHYPNLLVVFDILWSSQTSIEINGRTYEVKPMHAIYCGFLSDIKNAIKAGGGQVHYKQRSNDGSGNATTSWIFDIRLLHCLKEPEWMTITASR